MSGIERLRLSIGRLFMKRRQEVIVEFGSNKNCRIPMRKSAIERVEKQDAESND